MSELKSKFSDAATEVVEKAKDKKTWIGSYDYGFLCTPVWPYCRDHKRAAPHFFGKDENLGILTAMAMGLQHCLAMTGGLITPPLLIGYMSPDAATQTYLIQAAMLVCGFMTFVQVLGAKVYKLPLQIGSGILSVMGVSFTSVSTFTGSISTMMAQGSSFDDAYGRMMGTAAICCLVPMFISFVPYRYLQRVFPPVVLGSTIMLIGINLTGSGFLDWGGGNFCGTNYQYLPGTVPCLLPQSDGSTISSICYNAISGVACTGNGDVVLPYGAGSYIGMGFIVFFTIVILEIFGSPFMRNAGVVIALLFGYLMAVVIPGPDGNHFVNTATITQAPTGTFLWTKTFKWGVYAPAFIPLIIVFLITSIETMGDTSATEEASKLETFGPVHTMRIKGALMNDWVSSFFSSIAGSMPLTTFAQNNGVISLTGVASRQAGFACAVWLLLLGIFGKFGGWVLSIPACTLGGMTTFLFANVISSGIKILVVSSPLGRRDRFILACSLGLGIGITIAPQWATNYLWPDNPDYSPGLESLRIAILTVLSTPFCLGAITSIILNLLIPTDASTGGSGLTTDASLAAMDSKHRPLFEDIPVGEDGSGSDGDLKKNNKFEEPAEGHGTAYKSNVGLVHRVHGEPDSADHNNNGGAKEGGGGGNKEAFSIYIPPPPQEVPR